MEATVKRIRNFALNLDPWFTIILAPIVEESIFRFLPYQLIILSPEKFLAIILISNLVFALKHWYLGWTFTLLSFFAGLFYWYLMVNFGIVFAILGHSVMNLLWLKSGLFKKGRII